MPSEEFFKIGKCITVSTCRERSRDCRDETASVPARRGQILQGRVHFHSSPTQQRQSVLHTTNLSYAALKPFLKFTFVFKVHHLKRGAWTVLYSTGKSTKRKADFWKGSKTYPVSPNMVWMKILKKWPVT